MNHLKVYESIIQVAKLENRIKLRKNQEDYVYYENHHIIPLCLGGTNEKENLVLLTAREHYICHKLLTYIYKGNRKITLAFHKMIFGIHKENYKISSRDYKYVKELISLTGHSKITKQKIGKARLGLKLTTEWKNNISKATYGHKRSIETKKRISNAKKLKNNAFFKGSVCESLIEKYGEEQGKIKIQEYKYKLQLANKGRKHSSQTKEKLSISSHKRKYKHCNYCNKDFDPGNYGKWHGEKCKYKNICNE